MDAYAMQGRVVAARPTYKGGRDDDIWVWYVADHGEWWLGSASGVGTVGGYMFVQDSAATPDAVQGTWVVGEGSKRNSSVTVAQIAGSSTLLPRNRTTDLGCCFAGGSGIRISGLPSNHSNSQVLGDYTKQPGTEGGRPTYKGGARGDAAVWYFADRGMWRVGPARSIGTACGVMFAKAATAATPDAVPVGKWMVSEGWVPKAAVKCTVCYQKSCPTCTMLNKVTAPSCTACSAPFAT
jgi:hypothetical protein